MDSIWSLITFLHGNKRTNERTEESWERFMGINIVDGMDRWLHTSIYIESIPILWQVKSHFGCIGHHRYTKLSSFLYFVSNQRFWMLIDENEIPFQCEIVRRKDSISSFSLQSRRWHVSKAIQFGISLFALQFGPKMFIWSRIYLGLKQENDGGQHVQSKKLAHCIANFA